MIDKLQAIIENASGIFERHESAKLLLSWNHHTEEFILHDLTYITSTNNYFGDVNLSPLCFIVTSHIRLLKDPNLLKGIARDWFMIIQNLSAPPASTSIMSVLDLSVAGES